MTRFHVAALAMIFAAAALCLVHPGRRRPRRRRPDGAALFKEHCATCHVSGGTKGSAAPSVEVLAQKTQEEILRALESGPMVIYGNRMSEAERRAIAAYLSSKTADGAELGAGKLLLLKSEPMAHAAVPDRWNGWGVTVLRMRAIRGTRRSARRTFRGLETEVGVWNSGREHGVRAADRRWRGGCFSGRVTGAFFAGCQDGMHDLDVPSRHDREDSGDHRRRPSRARRCVFRRWGSESVCSRRRNREVGVEAECRRASLGADYRSAAVLPGDSVRAAGVE